MARGPAASSPVKEDDDGNRGAQGRSKRRCVQSACAPCRKRKSKCDGGTPFCATCTAVYKTECHYDEPENRRVSKYSTTPSSAASAASPGQKRDVTTAARADSSIAELLVQNIRSASDTEAHELVQHIRKNVQLDVPALLESWKTNVTVSPSTPLEAQSLESDLSVLLGKPAVTRTGESRHFGHSSGLGLVPEDENYTGERGPTEPKPKTWTTVTHHLAFVERLLELYFRWSHPFYIVFSRECFYQDFRSGRAKYCSPLLVNAILAYACHFTDEPAGRTNPTNFRTAGDHFFAEARRLLFEDESPRLTTAQALCVMSMREPSAGRDSSGFMYMGRCMRMCVEMGLHLNNADAAALGLTPSEMEVRKVTFWGCFTVDTVWSICIGRISQLPRAAITLDKPILDEPATQSGNTFPGAQSGDPSAPPDRITSSMFLHEFTTLSELVNDNNYMFFAPKGRLTSRRLLDCYERYLNWYKRLPKPLKLEGVNKPVPHIIVLHMLYHTVIIHLFRPMLKVDLIHSDVHPRQKCIEAANEVSALLRMYRKYYDMRACQLVITHILLSTSIVHLLYAKEQATSRQNLKECLQGLEASSTCHWFGARSFKIIHALSRKWNHPWPKELEHSKLLIKNDSVEGSEREAISPNMDSIVPPNPNTGSGVDVSGARGGMGFNAPLPPASHSSRRDSLSMFANAHPRAESTPNALRIATHPRTNSIVPNQQLHVPQQIASGGTPTQIQTPTRSHTQPRTAGFPPHAFSSFTQPPHSTPSQNTNSNPSSMPGTSTNEAETLFWQPVPGMGLPIMPRPYEYSPMDINNALGNIDDWDRFGQDGFKMSESWHEESVNANTFGDVPAGSYTGEVPGGQFVRPRDIAGGQHGPQNFDTQWWGSGGNVDVN